MHPYCCVFVCAGDVWVREVQSRWMAPSTGPVATCYPQQQVIKPPVYIPVRTSECSYSLWRNHKGIWICIVFYLASVKLKSYFLLNFEDKLFHKPWIWHRYDASADESFHPLRLGPITINITQTANEKDNRKKITSSLNLCLASDEQSGFSLHVFNTSERAGC